ncbi:adenosine deaminase [Paenibacillus spongiae]|uniref:adenosine deaminase n=1 Tax=Paenibacillus spongiae TaxID=2909671 RepID=A0ABY5SB32_9BACL|nr:adenosine deaminase [Paenibacillus spongiae]UVI30012.1 adenosine deaminase [Paenibacillus spongiae]
MDNNYARHELLAALPKADLHIHLDGSVKPETILALARSRGITLPADRADTLLPYMKVEDDCESLREYLSKFQFVLDFMQDTEALERIAYELVEQAAQEQCIYTEVRFAPQLHTGQGLSLDAIIGSVLAGLRRGEEQFGVTARVIVICMRHHAEPENRAAIEAAARFKDRGVVAVDLAGDEASYPASLFRGLFALAREKGLPVTIHAGEAAGPANIEEAVVRLGASRIGHGVRLRENADILELVKQRRIPLEMCPVSNIQTKAVSGWNDYPARDYIRQGLVVTVNTDNRTVSGTTMTREYRMLMDECGFGIGDIAGVIRSGFEAAFIGRELKDSFRRKLAEACKEKGILIDNED